MANPKKGGKPPKMSTPNIVMPDDLWLELRMQALKERTSASEIVRRLVSDYLKKTKKKGGNYGN
jgi:predicted CopG family antitoxin